MHSSLSSPINPISAALRRALRNAVANADLTAESGVHVDPLDCPPPTELLTENQRMLRRTPEMAAFARALTLGDADDRDVRAAVLDDLATYHGVSPEEARRRALHWEEDSLQEWNAVSAQPGSAEGVVEFYRTQQSWSYDLLWWAYLQTEGHGDPYSVTAYRWLAQHARGRRHLDFGAGVGVTSQLFLAGDWTSTLADLSSTLLDFARFRLERRGAKAEYIDLGTSGLPAGEFDAITAIDTLAHVPDVYATGLHLHAALAPGGYLIANFDIRKPTPETVWHLYTDDLQARYDLQRAGFQPVAELGYGLVAYRKCDDGMAKKLARNTWYWLTLVSPPRRLARRLLRPVLAMLNRRGR